MFPVGVVEGKFFKELGGIEIAEGVGGEVADTAKRPMDVLETTESVFRRSDAKELGHFLVPSSRNVFDFQGSFHEHFF